MARPKLELLEWRPTMLFALLGCGLAMSSHSYFTLYSKANDDTQFKVVSSAEHSTVLVRQDPSPTTLWNDVYDRLGALLIQRQYYQSGNPLSWSVAHRFHETLATRATHNIPLLRSEVRAFVQKLSGTPEEAFVCLIAAGGYMYPVGFDPGFETSKSGQVVELAFCRETCLHILRDPVAFQRYVSMFLWSRDNGLDAEAKFINTSRAAVSTLVFDKQVKRFAMYVEALDHLETADGKSREFWWVVRTLILFAALSGDGETIQDVKMCLDRGTYSDVRLAYDKWYSYYQENRRKWVHVYGESCFRREPTVASVLGKVQLAMLVARNVTWDMLELLGDDDSWKELASTFRSDFPIIEIHQRSTPFDDWNIAKWMPLEDDRVGVAWSSGNRFFRDIPTPITLSDE